MPTLQSHTFTSRTSRHPSQSLQKSVTVPTQEEFQNIFSSPSKKIKTPDTQTNTTKTVKRSIDNGLQGRTTRPPAGNSGNRCTTPFWNQKFVVSVQKRPH
jgi:hypothetical protein